MLSVLLLCGWKLVCFFVLRRVSFVLVLKLFVTERWCKGAIYILFINLFRFGVGIVVRWWRFISTMCSVRFVMVSGCVLISVIC